ncbi:MAG: malic enzyme-like NAD(P)-binding protein [Thermoanaerobaculia bacterium]
MSESSIDTVVRVRLEHRPGQFAKLATIAADEGALIGEIASVRVTETHTVRDVTLETTDEEQAGRVIAALVAAGVEVLERTDRVFDVHRGGKLHSTSRVALEDLRDLRTIYTPGVARVSQAIEKDRNMAWDLTSIGNSVGIFTNGTRVLGLGDIGPVASLPVMEGKAVLYDRFVGISATPLLVDTKDPNEFVDTVERLSHTFGAIHLEDIRVPDCFFIEAELKRRLRKPVMHDDQHGTACVTLAAIINACSRTGRDLRDSRLGQIGLGAAGSAIARLALAYGVGEVMVTDVAEAAMKLLVSEGAVASDLSTIMKEADIVIATTGKPGLIPPEMVRKGQVIFALSNPKSEITPSVARAAGAAFAGDGRSINNALAFPGIFRGAMRAKSREITAEMMVIAAETIAAKAPSDAVVPSPLDLDVHRAVADAVEAKARELGLADTVEL